MPDIQGRKVAIVATDGFEQSELTEPLKALRDAGATVHVVSVQPGEIRGWDVKDWGQTVAVDKTIDEVSVDDYDAVVLPGGQINPDKLRMQPNVVQFVRRMHDAKKPVAAICHGPWLLVEADIVRGKKVTSWPSIRTDLVNAGAQWVDQPVVVDQGVVTSRKPDDLPQFCAKVIEEVAEGRHLDRRVAA